MIIPIFRIFDIEKTDSFYIEYLGFKMDWKHQYAENMPFYFQVSLNNAVLHLSEHHGDASPGSAIRIKIKGLKSYHSLLIEKGYPYAKPAVEKTPWDTNELTVIALSQIRLYFMKKLSERISYRTSLMGIG